MNFCTARVAPEKAVFRPALPLHPLPGITEMKLSYTADRDFLNTVISSFPPEMISSLASLVIGYGSHDGYVSASQWLEAHNPTAQAGRLAWYMLNYSGDECLEIVNCFKQLGPDRFMEVIRGAVRKENEVR